MGDRSGTLSQSGWSRRKDTTHRWGLLRKEAWSGKNAETRAVGVKGLTTYEAYRPPEGEDHRRGTKATLNAVAVTRWKGREVSREDQTVLITTLPVDDPF